MKNIMFLTYLNVWSIDENKGAPSFYKTIEAYCKNGWNVILINPKYNLGVTPQMKDLKRITFNPIFFPLTKIRKIGFFGRIFHSLHGCYMLYKLGDKVLKELDGKAIIYAYEVHGVKAGEKLKEKHKTPLITRFQGTILTSIENNLLNRLKSYPHFQALETSADITIMTDDGSKGDRVLNNLKNQSNQIMFWKNGVDMSIKYKSNEVEIKELKEKLGLKPSNKVLITVSRLASWKKVNRAIEALYEVNKKNADVKLIIVGDGEEKEFLKKLAAQLSLTSNVIFTGAIEQTEVKKYLELADIFLSLYDISNVGNPLLEAMSCAKPIITLDVGDTASIISNEENGILLDIKHLNRIPIYIHKILEDRQFAEKLANNAKKYAKENFWSWDERMNAELYLVNQLYENWEFKSKPKN